MAPFYTQHIDVNGFVIVSVHLYGVFDRGKDDALHFFQATPNTEHVERLVEDIARASEAWLAKQGYAGEDEANAEDDDDAQGVLQMASINGRALRCVRILRESARCEHQGGRPGSLGLGFRRPCAEGPQPKRRTRRAPDQRQSRSEATWSASAPANGSARS